ncbi:NAD-dependent deacylase [Haloechinothrix sp. LS1_15]|uniref:SIR2 family NAD-dependent protein deacylase n=1 Tax=Haloechinothrix sp. LS1_15 TaxID=2652248 RepID=UPI002946276E|nr:NAD-dependent deacylase [Haloechinothrix sp. LS1_15]MDV6013372.1 NAD-dependent deacylase [Haloechinothrix sp. LS1_15]
MGGSDGSDGAGGADGADPSATTADQAALAELIGRSERIVALTGAGISVPSGIPDFRSPGSGLWENVDPMTVATIEAFHRDPKVFWDFYRSRLHLVRDTQPNAAHEALAELERRGKCEAVITQNIDRLHRAAGSRTVIEVHGSVDTASCTRCDGRWRFAEIDELFDSEGVARCTNCSGPVKPDVVLFGELLPVAAIERARELASTADLLLCVGSSLEVYPVAELPELTLGAVGTLAIVNQGPTPFDDVAAVRLTGDVATELPAVVDQL